LQCATTPAAQQQIWNEGEQLRSRVEHLADQVNAESARNAIINTPGSIEADIQTVAGLVRQLDGDIKASKASAQFKTAWRGFFDEWEKFVRETGYWARWWYVTKEKVDEYRRRLHDWRTMFVAEGGKPSGPEDHPPVVDGNKGWWKVAALGAGAVAVGAWLFSRSHHWETVATTHRGEP
jgi:hypothetical protein